MSQTRHSKLKKNVALLQRQIQTLDERIAHLLEKINSKSVDYTKASLFLGKIILTQIVGLVDAQF